MELAWVVWRKKLVRLGTGKCKRECWLCASLSGQGHCTLTMGIQDFRVKMPVVMLWCIALKNTKFFLKNTETEWATSSLYRTFWLWHMDGTNFSFQLFCGTEHESVYISLQGCFMHIWTIARDFITSQNHAIHAVGSSVMLRVSSCLHYRCQV